MKHIKKNSMKTLITIFAILLLFTFGCTDQTGITSPDNSTSNNEDISLGKKHSHTIVNDEDDLDQYTVSKTINGNSGGYISLGNQSSALDGQGVYAFLYFPAGSFNGTKTITMTINPEDLSGTFEPSMEFNTPVLFSALFTGVNLNGSNGSSYYFAYESPNGQQTVIQNSFLFVNQNHGVLGILNAQIPHFSRYAFLR